MATPPRTASPDSRALLAMNWRKDSLGLTMGTRGTSRDIPAARHLADSATRPLGTGPRSPWSPDACTWMGHRDLRLDTALTGRSVSCCLEDSRSPRTSCPSLSALTCHWSLLPPHLSPTHGHSLSVTLDCGKEPSPGPVAPKFSQPCPSRQWAHSTHSMVLPQSHHSVLPMASMSTLNGARQTFCKMAS